MHKYAKFHGRYLEERRQKMPELQSATGNTFAKQLCSLPLVLFRSHKLGACALMEVVRTSCIWTPLSRHRHGSERGLASQIRVRFSMHDVGPLLPPTY
jgi:hypothetical protein